MNRRPGLTRHGARALYLISLSALGAAPGFAQTQPVAPRTAIPDAYRDDIVITARRDAADDPETELSEQDIGRYGANTIADLLHNIGPLIDGTGTPPVVLVNGKRIGGASGVTGFPPEALARLAILPPDAAAKYGYPADQRVVNLVLKNKFASLEAELGATYATAGGRDSERESASRVVIDGSTYWNAQIQTTRDSMLFRSARPRTTLPDPVYLSGSVSGLGGQPIDPALDAMASREVTITGFPAAASGRPPTLADFAGAGAPRATDPDTAYALLPGGRSLGVNLGVTHPLGTFTGSLNVNVSTISSIQRLGYPVATLTLPAGNPWSPFGDAVVLTPDPRAIGPLETKQDTKTLAVSASLTGSIGKWNANLLANIAQSWSTSRFDRGLDLQDIQQRLDALDPTRNPYAPLSRGLLQVDRSRSRFASADAKLVLDRAVAKLPAGPLTANLSAGISRMTVSTTSEGGETAPVPPAAPVAPGDVRRTQIDLRASLAAPLAKRGHSALGDLSANAAIGATKVTGSATQRQVEAGLTWSPAAPVQLYAGYSSAQIVPDVAQLNGPRIETVIQIYDPIRQEVAQPVWITGGNPDLHRGARSSLTLKAMWRPWGRSLTLDLGYQRQVSSSGIAAFPQLTPAVEAAFPDRIVRNAAGRLIAIDARPINIARDASAQLTTGFTWLWSPVARQPTAKPSSPAAWQISLTVNHSWQLESLLTTDPRLPPLDRLGGAGGQPRHLVSMQVMAGRSGLGAILNGQWQSAARVDNPAIADGVGDLRFSAFGQFTLSFFVEPGNLLAPGGATKGWASNLRLSLDVQNVFDSFQRVTLADGRTAPGYDRYALNPLGRTVQLTVRKRF